MSLEKQLDNVLHNLNPVDFGEALFASAVEKPIDAVDQLTGNHFPEVTLVNSNSDTLAAKAGNLSGFVLDFALLARATGAALDPLLPRIGVQNAVLGSAIKMGVAGGIYGGALTPSAIGSNLIKSRLEGAFIDASSFAVMGGVGQSLAGTRMFSAESLKGKILGNAIAGGAGGVASALSTGLVESKRPGIGDILRSAGTYAAFGAAFGAVDAGLSKLGSLRAAGSSSPADESIDASASRSVQSAGFAALDDAAAESKWTGSPGYARAARESTAMKDPVAESKWPGTPGYKDVKGTGAAATDAQVAGSFVRDDGLEFWQMKDGRIIYFDDPLPNEMSGVDAVDDEPVPVVWAPYGTGKPISLLRPGTMPASYEVITNDEGQGVFVDSSRKVINDTIINQAPPQEDAYARSKFERAFPVDSLAIIPRGLESDSDALARLVPADDGELFERGTTMVPLSPEEGGQSGEVEIFDDVQRKEVPARTYYVLPRANVFDLVDLKLNADSLTGEGYAERLSQLREMATRVVVPEDFASQLDQIRGLRSYATLDPEQHPEQQQAILMAGRELFASHYGNQFLPEHLGQFLDAVPNRPLISEVRLLDVPSERADTAADAMHDGSRTITFYRDSFGVTADARRTLLHEWAHLTEDDQGDLRNRYWAAQRLENFRGNDYSAHLPTESWAVHMGEMVMDPNPELLYTLGKKAPISTLILSEALERELDSSQPLLNEAELRARIAYVKDTVGQYAASKFTSLLGSDDMHDVINASEGLRALGLEGSSALEGSSGPGGSPALVGPPALGTRFVDVQQLENSVNGGLSDIASGGYNDDLAGRTLLQMELLRAAAPDSPLAGRQAYDGLAQQLKGSLTSQLSSTDPADRADALSFLDSFTQHHYTGWLLIDLADTDALKKVASYLSDEKQAKAAFNLLLEAAPANETQGILTGFLLGSGPVRNMAYAALMGEDASARSRSRS